MSNSPGKKQEPRPQPSRRQTAAADAGSAFLPFSELWQDVEANRRELNLQKRLSPCKEQQEEIARRQREEAELLKKKAYEEGFARGREDGRAAGQEEYSRKVKQIGVVLAAVQNEIAGRNERYEEQILVLIKTMVDRLVHHEVSTNPEVIRACLREAMQFVVENSQIRVHLHADDLRRLQEATQEDPSLLAGNHRIQLVEDPGIAAGGCMLQTDFGEVDATLESCRQNLYEAVARIFAQTSGDDASAS